MKIIRKTTPWFPSLFDEFFTRDFGIDLAPRTYQKPRHLKIDRTPFSTQLSHRNLTSGWHPNPYVGREFHGVWGDFDVSITIDRNYVIGGTRVDMIVLYLSPLHDNMILIHVQFLCVYNRVAIYQSI